MAPTRSVTENGRMADVKSDLAEMVKAMPNHAQTSGRRALLTMLEGAKDATDDDTVNCSYNAARGVTGQIDITAVVTIVPGAPNPQGAARV